MRGNFISSLVSNEQTKNDENKGQALGTVAYSFESHTGQKENHILHYITWTKKSIFMGLMTHFPVLCDQKNHQLSLDLEKHLAWPFGDLANCQKNLLPQARCNEFLRTAAGTIHTAINFQDLKTALKKITSNF